MPRCGFCEATVDVEALENYPVEHYVDAWVCPECDAILGVGEIRGG